MLPSGETFENFQELKQILVTQQRERVIRNIVQRMMAYALCRKLEAYDGPEVEAIVKDLHENDGTFHDLIHKVAGSLPCQTLQWAGATFKRSGTQCRELVGERAHGLRCERM